MSIVELSQFKIVASHLTTTERRPQVPGSISLSTNSDCATETRRSGAGRILSIGHSDHSIERFVELLRAAGVTAVADVRSQPASGRLPQFNRAELEQSLRAAGIAYIFMGQQLGGRPELPSLYDADGRANYVRMRATAAFKDGLERLCRGMERFTIAMMCAEEDPLDCHRGLMITPALVERGIKPAHLRGDGSIESTAAMGQRLLDATGIGSGMTVGLFASQISDAERREMLDEAYERQSRRKAFRSETTVATGDEHDGN